MDACTDEEPSRLAAELVSAIRHGEDPTPMEQEVAAIDEDRLARELVDPADGRAFWLNIYNGWVQLLFERESSLYEESRRRFFAADRIAVAGRSLSLDDVEHRILRDGQWKYGLGYLPNPFRGSFARTFGVPLDPRIHFALNCGAASCPPVAVYRPADLDRQLDVATASYLESTVDYDPERNVATVPRQCLWFRGDFGGKAGILELLAEHGIIPPDARPGLRYASYDWRPQPRKFA